MHRMFLLAGAVLAMTIPAKADPDSRGFTIAYIRTGCALLPVGSCAAGDDLGDLQSAAAVKSVECSSAAYAAGLRVDDAILSIDGVKVDRLSSDEFWDLLHDDGTDHDRIFVVFRRKGSELRQIPIRYRPRPTNERECEDA